METILRLQTYLFCLLVLAVLWVSGNRRLPARRSIDSVLYRSMLLATAAMSILDIGTWLCDGNPGPSGRALVLTADCLYYVVHTLPVAFYVLYAQFLLFRDERRLARFLPPLIAAEAVVAAMAVLSLFRPLLFFADAGNHYHRGPLFPLFVAIQYGLVGYILVVLTVNRARTSRRVFLSLVSYPLPVLVAALGQMFWYGLTLIWPMTTVFLVIAFCNIENQRARTDYLTGVANRRSMDEELERRAAAARTGRPLSGLLIDIDDFKTINDTFGHDAGDRALEDVSRLLLSSVRTEDLVARMGGDEFVVLTDTGTDDDVGNLVARIECAVTNLNAARRRPFALSLSTGRGRFDAANGETSAGFLARLDADMYARKKAKKPAVTQRPQPLRPEREKGGRSA